jgi:hypothetical protein
MLENLYKAEYPSYLQTNSFQFNISSVLKDSVFYVVTHRVDIDLIESLSNNFYSFVIVSDSILHSGIEFIKRQEHLGRFELLHNETIPLSMLQDYIINPRENNDLFIDRGFFDWNVYQRSDGKRISVLLVCDLSSNAFVQLYSRNNSFPRVMTFKGNRHNQDWLEFSKTKEFNSILYKQGHEYPLYILEDFRNQMLYQELKFHAWIDFTNKIAEMHGYNVYSNSEKEVQYSDNRTRFLDYFRKVHHNFLENYETEIVEMFASLVANHLKEPEDLNKMSLELISSLRNIDSTEYDWVDEE